EGINFNFQIPPHIIIAIPHADRMRDLTPTHHKDFATSGGGPDFLRFLEKELVPHIDASYRTLPFRVLVGHSLGGLCTLNAMMAPDPAFQAFMAIDSAVWWDNDLVLARAKADPSPKKPLNSTIYLAWSGVPNPAPKTARAFSSIVKANTARGYRTESQVIPAEDHGSVPLISLYQGLQFIYDGYRPDLRNFEAHPAAITAHYQRVSNRIHSRLLPPEEIVHRVGAHVQPEQALGYFQLNVENYPGSVHAWEALAEACLAKGDRQQANTNYEKALQLDPDNPKIKAALDKVKGDAHN
ncbi:MAG: alpha/beta hydrolase-fold protein, partial [Holophaga sp.]|nr:alpha/beta hydrolase-fold protein [Holophaga sp.]